MKNKIQDYLNRYQTNFSLEKTKPNKTLKPN